VNCSLSQPFLDAGNPIIWVMYGIFWGIVSFIVAVVSEFLVLQYGFKFQKEKRFRYTLIANAASALIGSIPAFFLQMSIVMVLPSLIISVAIEYFVWLKLVKPEEYRKKTIFRYSIVANIVSYILLFGIPWMYRMIVAFILVSSIS
jgi:hypothetical protein